jgi:hypothetical protein
MFTTFTRARYVLPGSSLWHASRTVLSTPRTRALYHGINSGKQTDEIYSVEKTNDQSLSKEGLSSLPLRMLLRSMLIATISSRRYLLTPSLSILSFLSRSERSTLFNVDKNPFIHAFLKKTFYDQFCAGETEREAKATCQQLKDLGFQGVLLTFAKETVFDHRTLTEQSVGQAALENMESRSHLEPKTLQNADIDTWRQGTLQTIDLLGETDYLAVK